MPSETRPNSNFRKGAGTVLLVLSSVLLIGSAAAKLAHVPPVVAQLSAAGFDGSKLNLVGFLELVSALLFLIPVSRSVGLLLVSSFLGGAIATHLQHGQSIAPPSIVLLLIWLAAALRHPQILWSWPARRAGAAPSTVGQPHIA